MTGADQWGNPSTASSTFTVDTTGPAVSITSPADGSTVTTATPKLELRRRRRHVGGRQGRRHTVSKTSGDKLDALADGSHTVKVIGSDAVGNSATATSTFTVDTTGPAIAISKPADGATVTSHTPELDYTTGDAVAASVVVKVDGSTVDKASGDNLDALSDGAHTVTVSGADQWGNETTASSTFTVDTTGPAIAISKPANGSSVATATP